MYLLIYETGFMERVQALTEADQEAWEMGVLDIFNMDDQTILTPSYAWEVVPIRE